MKKYITKEELKKEFPYIYGIMFPEEFKQVGLKLKGKDGAQARQS